MIKTRILWKWVIVVSLIFLVFLTSILPQISNYSDKTIREAKSPDTSLIYSKSDLYDLAKSYGESGRTTYIQLRWTFDVIWPLIYTSFLLVWIIKLLEYLPSIKWLRYLSILPLISIFFDLMENIGTTIVMARYPLQSNIVANITPFMTLIKWVTISCSFLAIIVLVLLIILSKIKEQIINFNK